MNPKKIIANKGLYFVLLSIPVLLFTLPVLRNMQNTGRGDWDYFISLYAAARRSIGIYHQFPWWDPWNSGGVPLFANPQFGLFSIQMLLVLLLGVLVGLKLSVILYYLGGFWGMYLLLRKTSRSRRAKAALLSYIWTFSGYIALHFAAGHYTFLLYLVSPWLYYLYLMSTKGKRYQIGFVVFAVIYINSAVHYSVIEAVTFLAVLVIYALVKSKDRLTFIKRQLILFVPIALLTLPKVVLGQAYVSDYPRLTTTPTSTPIGLALRAFLDPFQRLSYHFSSTSLGWWEIGSYCGIGVVILFGIATAFFVYRGVKERRVSMGLVLALLTLLVFVIGLGKFGFLSPYTLIAQLPIFNGMQVPSRWFGWVIFGIVLTLSRFDRIPRVTLVILALSAIELFTLNIQLMSPFTDRLNGPVVSNRSFQLYDNYIFWIGPDQSSSMYPAFLAGYGEIKGYEPILGYNGSRPTKRCGVNDGCALLLTSNATIQSFTPNRIILARTGPGKIILNLNPGSYWLVNGLRLDASMRAAEPDKVFSITDPSQRIVVTANPL